MGTGRIADAELAYSLPPSSVRIRSPLLRPEGRLGGYQHHALCACSDGPNSDLVGNFESALEEGECLSRDEIRRIESEILRAVHDG